MKVFEYKGEVVNCDDGCPSVQCMMADGAEELPIEVFGVYAHLANSDNTEKINGSWVFNFDVETYEAERLIMMSGIEKEKRDMLLAESDWTQLPDTKVLPEQDPLWLEYRQALRDVPQQEGFPYDIVWPTAPGGE